MTTQHPKVGRNEFAGKRFVSFEEAQAATRQVMDRRNSSPLEQFSGLSAEQMHRFLHFPFETRGLVRFAEVFTPPREAPLMLLFSLLAAALGADGVRATAKGRLPRKLCQDALQLFLPTCPRDSPSLFIKVSGEEDFCELHLVRLVAGQAGFLRKRQGRFILTAKGREAAGDATGCRAFADLFRAFASRLNWGYFDGYPPFGIIQTAFLYSLYLLHRHGDVFRPQEFYGELFVRAFPAVLDETPPNPYFSPHEEATSCHGLRTFTRFAVLSGLVETRPIADSGRRPRLEIRKAPVLDEFVRFAV